MTAEIYLLRHGETKWNLEKRYQGAKNSPLTEKGRSQAENLGLILSRELGSKTSIPFHVSPLGRTLETAELIQKHIAFEKVLVEPRLAEVSMGLWEGLTHPQVLAGWPHLEEELGKYRALVHAPKGEGYDAALARVISWHKELQTPVVALSHGILGRVLRGYYLGLSQDESLILPVPQDVVYRLRNGKVDELRLS